MASNLVEKITIFTSIDADGDELVLCELSVTGESSGTLISFDDRFLEEFREIARRQVSNGHKVNELTFHCIARREI